MKTGPLLLLAAALLAAAPLRAQLVNYTFDSLTAGTLVGQDSWTGTVTNSPVVAAGTGLDTTLGLTNGTGTAATTAFRASFAAGSVTSSSVITLTFEFSSTSTTSTNNSYAAFGVGASSGDTPDFGVVGTNFFIRGDRDGTAYNPVNSGGALLTLTPNHVYLIQSVWDLSANGGQGSATLAIEDLTLGQTTFTPLYFNAAQTQTSVNLGITTTVANWTTAMVRAGNSAGATTFFDNLSATVAVPEPPPAAAFVGGGLVLLALLRLRRRSAA